MDDITWIAFWLAMTPVGWFLGRGLRAVIDGDVAVPRIPIISPTWDAIRSTMRAIGELPARLLRRVLA